MKANFTVASLLLSQRLVTELVKEPVIYHCRTGSSVFISARATTHDSSWASGRLLNFTMLCASHFCLVSVLQTRSSLEKHPGIDSWQIKNSSYCCSSHSALRYRHAAYGLFRTLSYFLWTVSIVILESTVHFLFLNVSSKVKRLVKRRTTLKVLL